MLLDMTANEVSAIIAHEVGHIKNKDSENKYDQIFIENLFENFVDHLTYKVTGFPGLVTIFLSVGVCNFIFNSFIGKANRRCEYLADMHSVAIMGSPKPLISALKKLESNIPSDISSDEKQRVAEIQQLYHKSSFLQDISDCFKEVYRKFTRVEEVSTHPLTVDRIFNMQLYARSNSWYAPIVRFFGIEEVFQIPKLLSID